MYFLGLLFHVNECYFVYIYMYIYVYIYIYIWIPSCSVKYNLCLGAARWRMRLSRPSILADILEM